MRNNYLGFIGFLSLTALLASGCATQGMAKMDDGSAATTATPSEAPAADTASTAADAEDGGAVSAGLVAPLDVAAFSNSSPPSTLFKLNFFRASLRVMSPDTGPIYEQSATQPGAYLASCHSGVTLAAVHAQVLAPAIANGPLPASLASFSTRRFDVSKAA